ncbi:hypothetical protein [Segetibacter sp. 3557_3]|nr:hypothetical protein [Segetibacter sp. 3557_3]
MESEIIQTVLAEVLDELKEVEQQQVELIKGLAALAGRMETF